MKVVQLIGAYAGKIMELEYDKATACVAAGTACWPGEVHLTSIKGIRTDQFDEEALTGVAPETEEAEPEEAVAEETETGETETEETETEEEGEKIAGDPVLEHFLGIEKAAEAEVEVEIDGADEYELKLAAKDQEAAAAFKVIKEAAKGKKGKKLWESIKALAGKKGTKGKKAKGFLAKGIAAVKGAPKATQKSLRAAYKATMKSKGVATGAAAAGAGAGMAGGYAAGKSKKKK